MAWSVLTWKISGFSEAIFYLKRFVLKHATAHIHKRCASFEKNRANIEN
jgi:hypothetical protein